jgi:hypothetical protein
MPSIRVRMYVAMQQIECLVNALEEVSSGSYVKMAVSYVKRGRHYYFNPGFNQDLRKKIKYDTHKNTDW